MQLAEISGNQSDLKRSIVEANVDLKQSMKEYLSTTDKFAVRLRASITNYSEITDQNEQNKYFITPIDKNINNSGMISSSQRGDVLDAEK